MAQITLSSNSIIRPYRTGLGSPTIRFLMGSTFAANSSVIVGDVVQSDTNVGSAAHRFIRMANHVPSTAIFGIAAGNCGHDGSTGANGIGSSTPGMTAVYVANPDTEFLGYTKEAGTGSTSIGTNKALKRDSTLGIWYLADMTGSTTGDVRVRVTGVPSPGDTNGAMVFRFMSTALVFSD